MAMSITELERSLRALRQVDPLIRALTEYQAFWEAHSRTQPLEDSDGNVNH